MHPMSDFSDMLTYLIHSKNIKVASMAQYCNIDRANMYKIISGKRNPSSLDLVKNIADFMKLTPAERTEFFEAYHITIIGKTAYYRRKSVLKYLLNDPVQFSSSSDSFWTDDKNFSFEPDLTAPCTPLYGINTLQHTAIQILQKELERPDCNIRIIAQPTWSFLFDMLQFFGHNNPNLTIEHIFYLSSDDESYNLQKQNYNIICLQKITPFYQCACTYYPYYYYNNIDSDLNNLSGFSYMILTTEYTLCCLSNTQYGTLYHTKDMNQFFQTIFNKQKQKTTLLFHKINTDLIEYFNLARSFEGLILEAQPCLTRILTPNIIGKLLNPHAFNRELFIKHFMAAATSSLKNISTFTRKVLEYFMQTGKYLVYPEDAYIPASMQTRILLLQRIYEQACEGNFRLITGRLENLPLSVYLQVSPHCGFLLFRDHEQHITYLKLEEKSLLHAFYDFMESLESEDYLGSKEETVTYLQDMLEYYKKLSLT